MRGWPQRSNSSALGFSKVIAPLHATDPHINKASDNFIGTLRSSRPHANPLPAPLHLRGSRPLSPHARPPPPLPWSDKGSKTILATPRGKVLSSAGRISLLDTRVLDAQPDAVAVTHTAYIGIYRGTHLFAAACSDAHADAACACAEAAAAPSAKHVFVDGRAALGMCCDEGETEALCSALAILNWQQTNRFCPACGGPTTLRPDGFKQFCAAPACSRHGSPKSIYPSIQPVVISAVLSHDRKRLLLGRKKEWPKSRYSCLAGFIEAGESVEEAARREVHEESAVLLSSVSIHSSQSWPFPSQLMVGCISVAAPGGETIAMDDDELEDARWFDVADVAAAVQATLSSAATDAWAPQEHVKFSLPPKFAVAFQLLKAACEGAPGIVGQSASSL